MMITEGSLRAAGDIIVRPLLQFPKILTYRKVMVEVVWKRAERMKFVNDIIQPLGRNYSFLLKPPWPRAGENGSIIELLCL